MVRITACAYHPAELTAALVHPPRRRLVLGGWASLRRFKRRLAFLSGAFLLRELLLGGLLLVLLLREVHVLHPDHVRLEQQKRA